MGELNLPSGGRRFGRKKERKKEIRTEKRIRRKARCSTRCSWWVGGSTFSLNRSNINSIINTSMKLSISVMSMF